MDRNTVSRSLASSSQPRGESRRWLGRAGGVSRSRPAV